MSEIKTTLIGVRLSSEEKSLIKKAALKAKRSVSQYTLIKVLEAAEKDLSWT